MKLNSDRISTFQIKNKARQLIIIKLKLNTIMELKSTVKINSQTNHKMIFKV